VIDFRIYRAGFLPALIAVVILLFALQVPPPPLAPVTAPVEFDQVSATKIARQIVDEAPVRTPGSAGDEAIAELVERQFRGVRDAQVAEQRFTGSFNDEDVDLRNLILTLPGASPRSVVIMAARDSASGPGGASSAAATATLLELVRELEDTRHTKTLIFVSTDGGTDGALGAREFAAHFPQRDAIDGVIVLWQPGSANPRPPFLLDTSDGPRSASSGLVRTAERALAGQDLARPPGEGIFAELARLALPSGLGEAAVLIGSGIDAVALSSAGELPLPASEDQPEDLSASTLGDFGRAALSLAVTLDAAPAPPDHGPDAYVTLSGSLLPGWALSLLALTLLLPAAIAAFDGLARALRRQERIGWGLWWSTSRGLPLIIALLVLYLLAISGIVARPRFPFDPNQFGVGAGQVVVMALLGLVILSGYYVVRGWRVPAGLETGAAAASLGLISVVAVLLAWLANPFAALLLVPAAHVWLLDATGRRALWPAVLGVAALSLVPLGAAVGDLVGRLELSSSSPWHVLLMVGDGQIGFGTMLAVCLVAGCLVGVVALAGRGPSPVHRPEVPTSGLRPNQAEAPPAPTARGDLDASPIARTRAADDHQDGR
jgi:hypothetical protein